jgi:ubiquinone/menaquinone biosynthesis C-methylase UbiE
MATTNFDWVFYVNFYHDLLSAGLTTEDKARDHYSRNGISEERRTHIDVENASSDDIYAVCPDSFHNVTKPIMTYINQYVHPEHHVLELECGIACHSLSLIKSLTTGHYTGFEPHRKCYDWCIKKIAPVITGATFVTTSKHASDQFKLPFGNEEFDVVYTTHSFLNISPDHVSSYLIEIGRVLKTGGRLILTAFLWNQSLRNRNNRIRFNKVNSVTHLVNTHGEHVMTHCDKTLYTCFEKAHYMLKETIFGHWSGSSSSPIYPDIINLAKLS